MEERDFITPVISRHCDVQFYKELMKDTPGFNLDDYFKFAFVRNPYDRLASGVLNHALKEEENPRAKFNDFLFKYRNRLDKWITIKPMHTFVCLDDKISVDFIGKFENIEEDWNTVCERIGEPNDLQFINKGKHKYDNLYTPESIKLVQEIFKKDFEMFGYDPDDYEKFIR